jgi:hypothetical protein
MVDGESASHRGITMHLPSADLSMKSTNVCVLVDVVPDLQCDGLAWAVMVADVGTLHSDIDGASERYLAVRVCAWVFQYFAEAHVFIVLHLRCATGEWQK